MIIKSNNTLVNNLYAHTSFPSSISNKRVCLEMVEEELIRFKSQRSLLAWIKPTSLPTVKHAPSLYTIHQCCKWKGFGTARDVGTAQVAYVLPKYVAC